MVEAEGAWITGTRPKRVDGGESGFVMVKILDTHGRWADLGPRAIETLAHWSQVAAWMPWARLRDESVRHALRLGWRPTRPTEAPFSVCPVQIGWTVTRADGKTATVHGLFEDGGFITVCNPVDGALFYSFYNADLSKRYGQSFSPIESIEPPMPIEPRSTTANKTEDEPCEEKPRIGSIRSLTRTQIKQGEWILDAIDETGRAWFAIQRVPASKCPDWHPLN